MIECAADSQTIGGAVNTASSCHIGTTCRNNAALLGNRARVVFQVTTMTTTCTKGKRVLVVEELRGIVCSGPLSEENDVPPQARCNFEKGLW